MNMYIRYKSDAKKARCLVGEAIFHLEDAQYYLKIAEAPRWVFDALNRTISALNNRKRELGIMIRDAE